MIKEGEVMKKIKLTQEEFKTTLRQVERQSRERFIQQIEALCEPLDGDRIIITGTRWDFLKKL